ncbi:hypothetical protein [Limimaricola litoreus]|uniref:Uncharacterized protein n=1 Tax=Limimaricola litoreus TaxID=2955316 RepID=A0A9X2FNJ6_9RHOB|nr:hypothetical protein [Limimaricola litoreus]MCP1168394.1 hypothetical protein [Limimaricola litoreus]
MSIRIALCFFGITRSLSHTLPSIEENVLDPARAAGELRVFAHFFNQQHIANPRSGEIGQLRPNEHELLPCDSLQLEQPDHCLEERGFDRIKSYGDDHWKDEFASIRNLVHQLHSLDRVTTAALAFEPDICIFCRPDLRYHDSLAGEIAEALRTRRPQVSLPRWQSWRGQNDRFAICTGEKATSAYGRRIGMVQAYCEWAGGPLHAEGLVHFTLRRSGIKIRRNDLRASRIRHNGIMVAENFDEMPRKPEIQYRLRKSLAYQVRRSGFEDIARTITNHLRSNSE